MIQGLNEGVAWFQANPVVATIVVLLWLALLIYGASSLWWLFEVLVLARGWQPETDHGAFRWGVDDVQVRVLTVDSAAVVQGTVDSLPDSVADVRVIAEREIEIEGASVHVVPESFTCRASNKGRAVEWARLNVPCAAEYVLYLDEDTIVTDFTGVPDADIVQFTEKPIYTGSWLTYLCEVFRVGYQAEQKGFHRLRYPLYAWGGGLAIRHAIEDRVTWDEATVTEDTSFIWRAARDGPLSYRLVDARFRNQAPPSVRSMIRQRRRWISGSLADDGVLPLHYRPLYYTRIVAWAFSPLVPLLVVTAYLVPGSAPNLRLYSLLSTGLLGLLFVYMLGGLTAYRKRLRAWPLFLLGTPLAVVLHAGGAIWGVLSPVKTFEVTEKLTPRELETVHTALEPGAIAAHDGTGRLVEGATTETGEASPPPGLAP